MNQRTTKYTAFCMSYHADFLVLNFETDLKKTKKNKMLKIYNTLNSNHVFGCACVTVFELTG